MFDLLHDPLKGLREFFHLQSEALQNASALLGGQPGVLCVQALMDDLAIQRTLTSRMKRNLTSLHKILSSESVHGPDRIEATCFVEIDPGSSIMEDICQLSDEFNDHLRACLFAPVDAPIVLLLA